MNDPNPAVNFIEDAIDDNGEVDALESALWDFPISSAAYMVRDYRSLDRSQYAMYALVDAARDMLDSMKNSDGTFRRIADPIKVADMAEALAQAESAISLRTKEGLPTPLNDFLPEECKRPV